jgi:hypothetical protein
VSEHELLAVQGWPAWRAECSCGWRSTAATVEQNAEARWRIHCGERSAARWISEATALTQSLRRRGAELEAIRATTTARRASVRERRWELRSLQAHNRPGDYLRPSSHPAPWQLLNRARSMAGCSVSTLWFEYFLLGGAASYEDFAGMLMGVCPMSCTDHDLTATVLNERFVAAGLGSPIASVDATLREPLELAHDG